MISYAQMIAELQKYCNQTQTGTVLISTTGGTGGKFGLVNGQITGVVFANQRGPRALDLVKSCSELDLSFWKGKSIVPADPDLPPTGEILTSLKNGAITRPNGADPHYTSAPAAPAAPAVNKPQKPVETERSPLPSAGSDTPLPAPAALRVILETELTRSIGPVAAVYIERYASQINSVRNHHQLTQLLRVLAGKAASPQTASEFFERVLVNLRSP